MRLQITRIAVAAVLALLPSAVHAQAAPAAVAADPEADYTRRITQRSEKFVALLELNDPAKSSAVQTVLMDQYRAMRALQEDRDARLAALPTADPAPAARIAAEADAAMAARRKTFDAELSRHLTPEQVERVKDVLTHDMVPSSIRRLETMYPGLTPPQRARVHAYLLSARDLALDAGTVEEKLDAFRAIKFPIDRYLTHQGYDVKTANAAWEKREAERKAAEAATRPASPTAH